LQFEDHIRNADSTAKPTGYWQILFSFTYPLSGIRLTK